MVFTKGLDELSVAPSTSDGANIAENFSKLRATNAIGLKNLLMSLTVWVILARVSSNWLSISVARLFMALGYAHNLQSTKS